MQSAEGAAATSRLDAGTSRLDQTCRQVAKARGEHVDRLVREEQQQQRRHARDEQCTARPSSRLDQKAVDWIMDEPVNWMDYAWKKFQTGVM